MSELYTSGSSLRMCVCVLAGLDRPLTVYLILNVQTKILHRTENAYIVRSWHYHVDGC